MNQICDKSRTTCKGLQNDSECKENLIYIDYGSGLKLTEELKAAIETRTVETGCPKPCLRDERDRRIEGESSYRIENRETWLPGDIF